VGGTARPKATATPRSENILRRETISHSILSIIFNLLDFDDNGFTRHSGYPVILRARSRYRECLATANRAHVPGGRFLRTLTHAGGARIRAISDLMSANICRDSATSAIWNVT
jgi:hypothetical protein